MAIYVLTLTLLSFLTSRDGAAAELDPWRPLSGPFMAIKVARYHDWGCALSDAGKVACWGREVGRRPGATRFSGTAKPQLWTGIDDAVDLAVGRTEVCVARRSGRVSCLTPQNSVEAPVADYPIALASLTAAANGFCGVGADGKIVCWGWVPWLPEHPSGQVVPIAGLEGARSLACAHQACCALDRQDRLHCFGRKHALLGELEGSKTRPVVPEMTFREVALASDGRICGINTQGRARCLGQDQPSAVLAEDPLAMLIALGDRDACRVDPAGELSCEGGARLKGVRQVSLSERSGCAVAEGGAVFCWGDNESGGNGDGSEVVRPTPGKVVGIAKASAVGASILSSCALVEGWPRCWGIGLTGSLSNTARPVALNPRLDRLAQSQYFASCGQDHFCARLAKGEVRCWGHFYFEGFSRSWRSQKPIAIPEFANASDISARNFHTCAVVGKEVLCWGENDHGQLGTGGFEAPERPVRVGLPAGVIPKGVSVGDRHSCVLDATGAVWCWGDNSRGQLGDGRAMSSEVPVRVSGMGGGQSRPRDP